MKFGMILLGILALYATAGTLLPQGNSLSYYHENYTDFLYELIRFFKLHQVYDSVYFIVLTALLSLNLLFCTLRRIPAAWKAYQREGNLALHLAVKHLLELPIESATEPKQVLKHLGFQKVQVLDEESRKVYFSARRKAGTFGSSLVHAGLLLVILAFALGKLLGEEYFVRGIPDDRMMVGNTGMILNLREFDILYREDYSIHQYISSISMEDGKGTVLKRGDSSVNHPFSYQGYRIYQYGTGWVMDLVIKKKGEEIKRERFYQGDVLSVGEEELVLEFRNFYPDFVVAEGMPYTLTPFPNRPRVLYVLYKEGLSVDMNVAGPGQSITFGDYTMEMYEPRLYTVLQIVRDPGALYAGLGGLLMLLGLFLTFYYVPQYVLIVEENGIRTLYGGTQKNRESFQVTISEKLNVEGTGESDESD